MLAWAFQAAVAAIVVAILLWLIGNVRTNSEQLNIPTGFGYLDQPASFPIPGSSFRTTQPVSDALMEGLLNTVRVAVAGLVLSTLLGVLLGIVAAVLAVGLTLVAADRLARSVPHAVLDFATRVIGLLLAAIGVELIVSGIRGAAG